MRTKVICVVRSENTPAAAQSNRMVGMRISTNQDTVGPEVTARFGLTDGVPTGRFRAGWQNMAEVFLLC